MSELRSIVDSLRAEELESLPDARIEENFTELHLALEQLEAERLRRLAELDRRRLFERDGHLSAASWIVSRFREAWWRAKEAVTTARALEHMPICRRALEAGDVTLSAIRVLARAREAEPEAFARAETQFADAASAHPLGDLRRIVAFWREMVDEEKDPEARSWARRRLHASTTFDGMVRVDGDLDPETGECLLTALRAVLDADSRSGEDDARTPAQRRCDALGEICRGWLDLADRSTVAGERPHLTLTVPVDALLEGARTAELDHAGPVGASLARRLACDAFVRRVVLGPSSEPLDVGRRTHVVPPSMRRAVIVRDGGCRFPGCDRPHPWCDAHHVVHWADGGATAATNLVLLCRRHHRLIHRPAGFIVEMADGRPVFRRPDGSLLEDRPSADRAPP